MSQKNPYQHILSHPLWEENRIFSPFEAWFDLITEADDNARIYWSYPQMEIRWNWDKSKVRRFIMRLQKKGWAKRVKNAQPTPQPTPLILELTGDFRGSRHPNRHPYTDAGLLIGTINPVLDFDRLILYINQKTGRKFREVPQKAKDAYIARLKEGWTKEDIMNAIDNAVKVKIHKDNGHQYLTPEFFSRDTTLNRYAVAPAKSKVNYPLFKENEYSK